MTVHLLGSGTERSQGRLGGFRKFNYAPSLAEAVSILSGGVPESLRGASQVPVYESVPDTTAISVTSVTAASNATVAEESGWLEITATGGNEPRCSITVPNSISPAVVRRDGRILRVRYKAYIPATNTGSGGVIAAGGATAAPGGRGFNVLRLASAPDSTGGVGIGDSLLKESNRILDVAADVNIITPSVISGSDVLIFWFGDASSLVNNGVPNAGDKFYVKDIKISILGLTSQLTPESIQLAPGQWLDTSGKHAYIPDGFRLGAASRSGDLSSVLTWEASSTDPRYVTGVNASAVPANSAVTIYARATASGTFNIGDGSDATYYASAVSIGTTWTPITLTSPVNDGTNRKIVLTPTSAYAGSVTISAQVQVLA